MNKRGIGKQRIREIIGEKSESIIKMFEAISPDFANYVLDFGYGDLYSRKGFSDKHRELAAVACLIGQGNTGLPLKAHLSGMLNVGWKKEEIIELLIFLVGYSGFPACVEAITTFKQITEEMIENV
ncbi:MAG TPA: carboxymuconolactone decarboxylase family protein [Gammaproteobacteria bacterium]|nr:carboxymuconolactone decarboxylase family protein [Gammaproteobacteria bacterium]